MRFEKGKSNRAGDEGILLTIGEDGTVREYDNTWDITIHCEDEREQKLAWKKLKSMNWIPVTDGDEWKPPVDEDGCSQDILLSFSNYTSLCIGKYREDEEGGAFFEGDEDEPLTKIGLVINVWMSPPDRYREKE